MFSSCVLSGLRFSGWPSAAGYAYVDYEDERTADLFADAASTGFSTFFCKPLFWVERSRQAAFAFAR